MEILIIVLIIFLGISIYLNVIQNKKISILEKYCGQYITDLTVLKDKIGEANTVMNMIDAKGAFSSDDEVGTTFKLLKECITYLHNDNGETK